MYNKYLDFVKKCLVENKGLVPPDSNMPFRSKYDHTLRVFNWSKKLVKGRQDVDRKVLFTAAIFHDVGYSSLGKGPHAEQGAKIFVEYAKKLKMEDEFIKKVSNIISLHSSKELIRNKDVPIELILLIEADMLDEEGALRMVWYSIDKGITGPQSYEEIYNHIVMGNNKRLENPMVTEKGKYYWNRKQKLVEEFTRQLGEDIRIDIM